MDANAREVAGNKQFVELNGTSDGFDEDDNLRDDKNTLHVHEMKEQATWLNSRESSSSLSFLFFPTSSSLT